MHPSIARGAHRGVQRAGRDGRRSVLRQRHRAGRGDGGSGGAAIGVDASPLARRDRPRADDGARRGGARAAGRARPRASPRSRASGRASGGAPRCRAWARREIARFHAARALRAARPARAGVGDARGRRRARAAPLPVVDPGEVHEGRARGAARRRGEADRARHPVAHAGRPRGRAGARAGGAGAAHAAGHAGARGDRRRRARAADSRPAASALVLSSPPYAGTYDYAAQHETRFVWLGLSRGSSGACSSARGPSGSATSRARLARPTQARFVAEIARVLRAGRPRAAGGRRRRRRRPRRERARRRRGRGRRRSGSSRSRAPRRRARSTIAGWRRSSPTARAASTCCCSRNARPARLHVEATLASARFASLGSARLHFGGGGGRGAPRPSRASLESRRPQTIRAAAYASAEELPVPLRACVAPRLRFDGLRGRNLDGLRAERSAALRRAGGAVVRSAEPRRALSRFVTSSVRSTRTPERPG